MRQDGRKIDEIRPIKVVTDYISFPEGSVLFSQGKTQVLCNFTLEETVPRWMMNASRSGGWVTAEYAMLPRATPQRTPRETGAASGRTHEIKRLIGRALRSAVDLEKLGQRTCIIDCDVLQADGGTRCAAITGGFLALALGLKRMEKAEVLPKGTLKDGVAAISVGLHLGTPYLDLSYAEDSAIEVDANFVMNWKGEFIEIQSTAEGTAFNTDQFNQMIALACKGIGELIEIQKDLLMKAS